MQIVTKDTRFAGQNVIALGMFDGLHRAHRQILEQARQIARAGGMHSLVYTFSSLPSAYFGGEAEMLFSPEEKVRAVAAMEIDYLAMRPFDREIAEQSREEFAGEHNYEWVRRLLENQENTDAEEFVHTLKVDMFADEVFVFSPRGDVTNLPAGATPIDFAYSIHSAIGNRMTGAKVNGRIAPLDYQLKNGDIVEILTSKNAHGPSRDWLKIAKSSEARSKIRQWFKKERREENIINGRISFEAELKHLGIPMSDVLGTDIEAALLKKTSFGSMDEMYAAIGYGGFSAQKAVNRIHDEIVKLEKQRKEERAATVPVDNSGATRPAVPKRTKSEQGIVVEGLSNCLVKFSKCCTPVPGDEIVGFITRGYGVSVHRCDCPNAAIERRKPEERGRWIKVSWGTDVKESYQTALDIYAKDRLDLVLDVSAALSSSQTRVASINATTTADGFAVIHLSIFISDAQHLAAVMRRLHQISGVMKVDRPAG